MRCSAYASGSPQGYTAASATMAAAIGRRCAYVAISSSASAAAAAAPPSAEAFLALFFLLFFDACASVATSSARSAGTIGSVGCENGWRWWRAHAQVGRGATSLHASVP